MWCIASIFCDSAPCLGVVKPGSRVSKTLHLTVWISQICTPQSSPVWKYTLFGCTDKQNIWLGLLLGLLQVWTWFDKIWVLAVSSPSPILHYSQTPSVWALQIAVQSLWCEVRVRAPAKQPTMWCRGLAVLLDFLFSLTKLEVRGRPLHVVPCCSGIRAMQSVCPASPSSLMQSVFVSMV